MRADQLTTIRWGVWRNIGDGNGWRATGYVYTSSDAGRRVAMRKARRLYGNVMGPGALQLKVLRDGNTSL